MTIYRLEHDFENFLSFHIHVAELAKANPHFRPRKFSQPLSESWKEVDASFYKSENCSASEDAIPDISIWGLGYMVLSPKAMAVCQADLSGMGELLPCRVNGEQYFIFNSLYVVPDAAVDKSNAVEKIDIGVYVGSEGVAIDEKKLGGNAVFRSNFDRQVSLYCDERFFEDVKKSRLKGLVFNRV